MRHHRARRAALLLTASLAARSATSHAQECNVECATDSPRDVRGCCATPCTPGDPRGCASLRIQPTTPLRRSRLFIDGTFVGAITDGRVISNLTPTIHTIHIAPVDNGSLTFGDYTAEVTLQDGQETLLTIPRLRYYWACSFPPLPPPTSTWGAATLARGNVALDFLAGYGSAPLELRATFGLSDYLHATGFDVGASLRTLLHFWETELRARVGHRLLGDLLVLGLEARAFAGFGYFGQWNLGGAAYLLASLRTRPTADDEAAHSRVHVIVSLRLGAEVARDTLSGALYRGADSSSPQFDACDNFTTTAAGPVGTEPTMAMPGPCNLALRDQSGARVVDSGAQTLVRGLVGVTVELLLNRHWVVFASLDRVLASNAERNAHRALYQSTWFGHDSMTYPRLGLSYRF